MGRLTHFLNDRILPVGLKFLHSALLLEMERKYVEVLVDLGEDHPVVRCGCGSGKVFNYGLPPNNGRYFYCRACGAAFTRPVYREQWNEKYRCGDARPDYDFWLEQYLPQLEKAARMPVMDLGTGYGSDMVWLRRQGFDTVSCDYSGESLRRLRKLDSTAPLVCFDMADGLPFRLEAFGAIVASLSLHYFLWQDTRRIIGDIHRLLVGEGYLFCRVNSTRDTAHGAGQGARIEEHYYEIDGKYKRFFDEKQLRRLFRGWNIMRLSEQQMIRCGRPKIFWEVAVQKQQL